MPGSDPQPPATVPKYIYEGLQKQDDETLVDIQEHIDDILAQRAVSPSEISSQGTPITRDQSGETRGWVIEEKVKCGDDACHCADGDASDLHGPYKYLYYRKGGTLKKKYVENKPEYWQ